MKLADWLNFRKAPLARCVRSAENASSRERRNRLLIVPAGCNYPSKLSRFMLLPSDPSTMPISAFFAECTTTRLSMRVYRLCCRGIRLSLCLVQLANISSCCLGVASSCSLREPPNPNSSCLRTGLPRRRVKIIGRVEIFGIASGSESAKSETWC